jgi:F-type H+-transporting ATPase subunit delta
MPAKHTTAATQYAQAMLQLGNESQQAEALAVELRDLSQIVQAEKAFELFLKDPAIGETERLSSLERIFKGRVSTLLMNMLGVLNEHGRLGLIEAIAERYQQLLDKQLGNVAVDVTVAQPMDEATLETVRQRISAALKKNAQVSQRVDASIIGGLVMRVDDKVMDASVQAQLAAMKQKLMAAAPHA